MDISTELVKQLIKEKLKQKGYIPEDLEKILSVKKEEKAKSAMQDLLPTKEINNSNLEDEINNVNFKNIEFSDEEKEQIKELEILSKSIEDRLLDESNFKLNKKLKINYENELNKNQLIAVTSITNPLLVIAGAGSGKTRIITYKVAYLIENGFKAGEILLLTFTRKAADEMLNRVKNILPENNIESIIGGTFHSFANYALKKFGKLNNIRNNFSIIDTSDTEDIISLIRDELNIKSSIKGKVFPKKSKIQKIISTSNNYEMEIKETINKYFKDDSNFIEEIKIIKIALEEYKKIANLYNYDDLILVLRNCLRDSTKFRLAIQKRIKYILVDEYQDTNNIQREIVTYLASENENVTVVGDDSQSIYAFRGANFENILRFPETFEKCNVIKLEENYRSQKGILDFTNDIIKSARIGFKKNLYTSKKDKIKPIIKKFSDASLEAQYIVDKILELKNNELEFSDFAILTRASWHSNYIQAELTKRGINFIVVGGIKFSERRHIKDLISFLKIIINPLDALAWHRCLRLVEGVGKVRAREIIKNIHNNNGKIDFTAFANRKYFDEIFKMGNLMSELQNLEYSPFEITEKIINYYKTILQNIEDDYKTRVLDLDILLGISSKYENLEKFISEFTLEPPSNQFQDQVIANPDDEVKPLRISTIHSAKGLEWHSVFIPFALDGLIPSVKSLRTIKEIEEERRLFYVATSRAKKNLFITMPAYVASWGVFFNKPSRFLSYINKENYIVEY